MIQLSAWLFAAAAVGGATLATLHLRGKAPPWIVTVAHGAAAVTALLMLIVGVSRIEVLGTAHWALLILLLAALGGLWVLSYHLRGLRPPAALILVHGSGAATGLIVLLVYIFGG